MYVRHGILVALFGLFVSHSSAFRYNYHWLEDDCGREIHLQQTNDSMALYGFVRVNRDAGYSPNLNCGLTVIAPVNHRLVVRIRRIEIFQPSGGGRTCTADRMSIIGNSSSLTYCGFGRPSYAILSSSNFLTFQMYSESRPVEDHDWIGFDLYYTAFHEKDECDQSVNDFGFRNEFRCSSGNRCVPGELTCDMFDNCGDWSDEQVRTCGLSFGAKVAIGVVCSVVILSIAGFVGFYVYTKKKEKELRERQRNAISPTITADGNNPTPTSGRAEPPPPYTYSAVYTVPAPLPGQEEAEAAEDAEREPPPPAYTEHDESAAPPVTFVAASPTDQPATATATTTATTTPDATRVSDVTVRESTTPGRATSDTINNSSSTETTCASSCTSINAGRQTHDNHGFQA